MATDAEQAAQFWALFCQHDPEAASYVVPRVRCAAQSFRLTFRTPACVLRLRVDLSRMSHGVAPTANALWLLNERGDSGCGDWLCDEYFARLVELLDTHFRIGAS